MSQLDYPDEMIEIVESPTKIDDNQCCRQWKLNRRELLQQNDDFKKENQLSNSKLHCIGHRCAGTHWRSRVSLSRYNG